MELFSLETGDVLAANSRLSEHLMMARMHVGFGLKVDIRFGRDD